MPDQISRKDFLHLGAAALAAGAVRQGVAATPVGVTPRRTVIRNVDVLTMRPDRSELHGVDVLLADGKVAAIGRSLAVTDAEMVDGIGRILMPGLIDGFRNNWQAIDTGRLSKLDHGMDSYFVHLTRLTNAMTPDDRYLSDRVGAVEAINSGYTAMVDLDRFGTVEGSAAALAGARSTGIGGVFCHSLSPAFPAPLPDEAQFRRAAAFRDAHFAAKGDGLAFSLLLNLQWGATFDEIRTYFARARALRPQVIFLYHHSWGGGFGGTSAFAPPPPSARVVRTVDDLRAAGVLGPDLLFGHATELTDAELRMLAAEGVSFTSAVLSEFTYPQGQTSIHARARAAGAAASIGFDAMFGQSRDPFEMVRAGFVALYKTPDSRRIADTLGSHDALTWMTRDAARCAGMADVAGTVTVGGRADVVLIDTARLGFPVIGTLADRIASFGTLADIDSVWIGGVPRKRDGRMVGIDMAALKNQLITRQQQVWERAGHPRYGPSRS